MLLLLHLLVLLQEVLSINLFLLANKNVFRNFSLYICLLICTTIFVSTFCSCVLVYSNNNFQSFVQSIFSSLKYQYFSIVFCASWFFLILFLAFGIIYNIFSIYQERRRDFGILFLNGLSWNKCTKLVFLEICFILPMATFLGSLISWVFNEILMRIWIRGNMKIPPKIWTVPIFTFLIVMAILVFIYRIGCLKAARNLSKEKLLNLFKGRRFISVLPKVSKIRAISSFIIFIAMFIFGLFIGQKIIINIIDDLDWLSISLLIFWCLLFFFCTYFFLSEGVVYFLDLLRKKESFSYRGSRIIYLSNWLIYLKRSSFIITVIIFSLCCVFTSFLGLKITNYSLDQPWLGIDFGPKNFFTYELGQEGLRFLPNDKRVQALNSSIDIQNSPRLNYFTQLKKENSFLEDNLHYIPVIDFPINFDDNKVHFYNLFRILSIDDYNILTNQKIPLKENSIIMICDSNDSKKSNKQKRSKGRFILSTIKFVFGNREPFPDKVDDIIKQIKEQFPNKEVIANDDLDDISFKDSDRNKEMILLLNPKDFSEKLNDIPLDVSRAPYWEQVFNNTVSSKLQLGDRNFFINVLAIYKTKDGILYPDILKKLASFGYFGDNKSDHLVESKKMIKKEQCLLKLDHLNESQAHEICKRLFLKYKYEPFDNIGTHYFVAFILTFILILSINLFIAILAWLYPFMFNRFYQSVQSRIKQLYSLYYIGVRSTQLQRYFSFSFDMVLFLPCLLAILIMIIPLKLISNILKINFFDFNMYYPLYLKLALVLFLCLLIIYIFHFISIVIMPIVFNSSDQYVPNFFKKEADIEAEKAKAASKKK